MQYAYVSNGNIVSTYTNVPHVFGNTAGFDVLPDELRAERGFYRVLDARPPLPSRFHRYDNDHLIFANGTVRREANVVLLPIEQIRQTLKDEVNQLRDAKMSSGVSFMGHTFDSDPRSLQNLTATVAAVAAGIPLPQNFAWRTAANVDVPMTAVELVTLAGMTLAHMNALYQASWAKKAEIDAAEAPETCDLEQGWPT